MKLEAIIFAIFCFSLVTTAVNDIGVFDTQLHETDMNMTQFENAGATIYEVEGDALSEESEFSLFMGVGMLMSAFKIFLVAVAKTAIVAPTLMAYGVHTAIAVMIQGVVTYIEVIGIIQFASNRGFKGMR